MLHVTENKPKKKVIFGSQNRRCFSENGEWIFFLCSLSFLFVWYWRRIYAFTSINIFLHIICVFIL